MFLPLPSKMPHDQRQHSADTAQEVEDDEGMLHDVED